jgi:predicted nucleic-acid-binding Zn-ribbon protein
METMAEHRATQTERPAAMAASTGQLTRNCPWCGNSQTELVQRGYTGPTDEVDQYFTCADCGKITYELVSKSAREMRLGRFRAGGIFKDNVHQTRYRISRILKVGLNEYLIYLKPLPGAEED